MNILKAIIFGIIEGITEWMPISSTAHMKILNIFLPLDVRSEFYDVFEVIIQLGAIIALFIIFFKKVWPFGKTNRPLGEGILKNIKKNQFILWIKIIIACLPAIIYELFLDDYIQIINEKNEMTVIGLALIIVGILFIATEWCLKGKKPTITNGKQLSLLNALLIGSAQLIAAVIPGISRSGATIIVALLLGTSRVVATEFTYELAIPVMFGASLMKILSFLKKGLMFSFEEVMISVVACSVSFVVSLFMISFMLDYIKKNKFNLFGFYRIATGIIVLLFLR